MSADTVEEERVGQLCDGPRHWLHSSFAHPVPMGLPRADELLLVSKNSQSIARQVYEMVVTALAAWSACLSSATLARWSQPSG
jgi:hypothetical protein